MIVLLHLTTKANGSQNHLLMVEKEYQ